MLSCTCISGAYEWAQKTLKDHAKDERPYIYTREQLEKAKTHDGLWNGAQVQYLGWLFLNQECLPGKNVLNVNTFAC